MIKSWYDVIHPHEDIREGHFDEAVFAADLGDVLDETAASDYRVPYLFYKKTYLTHGLTNLLGRVHAKLTTGQGPLVVQIQTPFGGGKTHALVAIYHYLQHDERVEELLPLGVGLISPNVATVVGNHWNPLAGRASDGITRRTFWGEVAYQIGGRATRLFAKATRKASRRARTSCGPFWKRTSPLSCSLTRSSSTSTAPWTCAARRTSPWATRLSLSSKN